MNEYLIALIGGVLIWLAAVLLLAFLGRIAGISGIVWGAVTTPASSAWRWLFLVGLLVGAWFYHAISGVSFPVPSGLPWWQAAIAGILVGFGVKLGSGCTSGHGVCGIGRLSMRSLIATLTFMATGIITVFVLRHIF
ncbi:MAG TPA: YeeE/YedE thiosulfate transporter family protein [Cellvibrionaceae bacterium]